MGFITYVPTLLAIVHRICIYTARHDTTIRHHLPPAAVTAYNGLRVACDAFVLVVQEQPSGG